MGALTAGWGGGAWALIAIDGLPNWRSDSFNRIFSTNKRLEESMIVDTPVMVVADDVVSDFIS